MDKNQGYSILKAVMLENGRGFALGHHPTAPSPYVTWACYDDKNGQIYFRIFHLRLLLLRMNNYFHDVFVPNCCKCIHNIVYIGCHLYIFSKV